MEEEAQALDRVVDRLAERFPGVDREHAAAIVGGRAPRAPGPTDSSAPNCVVMSSTPRSASAC
ncbi:three-helix bundle dimerization domain-containing protein [Agromyces bauzanensis]|uniref:three-helix bundle dimerization domain-containing protein n=1 Tax=Agromyces bauzanensis TaxID=1308924 RepID=UPI0035711B46